MRVSSLHKKVVSCSFLTTIGPQPFSFSGIPCTILQVLPDARSQPFLDDIQSIPYRSGAQGTTICTFSVMIKFGTVPLNLRVVKDRFDAPSSIDVRDGPSLLVTETNQSQNASRPSRACNPTSLLVILEYPSPSSS